METPTTLPAAPVPWLARRQEEEDARTMDGCTLPPKVQAAARGAVLLSVPHVLQSSAADAMAERHAHGRARLPRATLVRVRWRGEGVPGGSLFRPTLLKEDDEEGGRRSPNGPIQMRYPVCVTPSQLLEYFRDMKELVFDVVDRDTRKKVGRSVLSLAVERTDDTAETAETVLQKLCRTNMLCEIHATDRDALLGYLTVSLDVQWDESPVVSTPLKWANNIVATPVVSINRALLQPKTKNLAQEPQPERKVQQRLSFSSVSLASSSMVSHQDGDGTRLRPWQRDVVLESRSDLSSVHDQSRLDQLLERGRDLQRSMSKAMAHEKSLTSSPDPDPSSTGSTSPMNVALVMAPYEVMTEEIDDNTWERVLEESEPIAASMNDPNPRPPTDAEVVSLGDYNGLELSFELMELEQDAMERLRQLREGSISTRFSPVQIVVSHEQPVCLFSEEASKRDKKWIAAFAVNSSLRKRHWRPKYTHALPLFDGATPVRPSLRQTTLRLRVRCQPQHASPPGRRRREAPSTINFLGDIPVDDLFAHIHRERVVSITLYKEDEDVKREMKRNRRLPRKPRQPVGRLQVKLRFCALDEEVPSDSDESSLWSKEVTEDPLAYHPKDISPTDLERSLEAITSPRPRLKPPELGAIPMFFALIAGQAKVKSPLTPKDSGELSRRLTLRLEYGTPTVFCRSAKVSRLKRSAKAVLRPSINDTLRADLNHMNVFPIELNVDLAEKLRSSVLILEAWVVEQSTTLPTSIEEKFLGVIKIPLSVFKRDVRDGSKIAKASKRMVPLVRIDQDFPIIDPFDDTVNGQMQIRIAFGSAEQLFNLKSTIMAVVKLQSRVRGWRTRRALKYWKQFELSSGASEVDVGDTSITMDNVTSERDDSNATNDVATASTPRKDNLTSSEKSVAADRSSRYHPQHAQVTQAVIQVSIRDHYVSAAVGHSILGCEVFGQLRVQDELINPSATHESDGPKFMLWWDAQNSALNSNFKHSLHASDVSSGLSLRDASFVFRIQPQEKDLSKIVALSPDVTTGVAVLELGDIIDDIQRSDMNSSEEFGFEKDVDVLIVWDGNESAMTNVLPLRIRLQLTSQFTSRTTTSQENVPVRLPRDEGYEYGRTDRVALVRSVSRTERLLPASLWLCLDVQRISDMKDLLIGRLLVAKDSMEDTAVVEALDRAFVENKAVVTISMSLCVGVDLTSVENDEMDPTKHQQDDKGRWYKNFDFERIQLNTANEVQALPSTTQGYVHAIVHPELIESFQHESLHIKLILEGTNAQVVLGDVQVSLTALLFRPSGVQGSFPVRVKDDVQGGRVGVHLYIDQDGGLNSSRANYIRQPKSPVDHQSTLQSHSPPIAARSESHLTTSDDLSEEKTLEQAVASIHEAARHIQDRLSRLPSLVPDPQLSSSMPTSGDSSSAFSPDQPLSPGTSSNGHEQANDDIECDAYSDVFISDEASTILDTPHVTQQDEPDDGITSFVVQADVRSDDSKSDGASTKMPSSAEELEDEAFFTPLTLESFGIVEMEMSPVSPTFSEATSQSASQAQADPVADEQVISDEVGLSTSYGSCGLRDDSESMGSLVSECSAGEELEQCDPVGVQQSSPIDGIFSSHGSSFGSNTEVTDDWQVVDIDDDTRSDCTHLVPTEEELIKEREEDQERERLPEEKEELSFVDDDKKVCESVLALDGRPAEESPNTHGNVPLVIRDADIDHTVQQNFQEPWSQDNNEVPTSSTEEEVEVPITESDVQFTDGEHIADEVADGAVDEEVLADVDIDTNIEDATSPPSVSQSSPGKYGSLSLPSNDQVEARNLVNADEEKQNTAAESDDNATSQCPEETSIGQVSPLEHDNEGSLTLTAAVVGDPVSLEEVQPMTNPDQDLEQPPTRNSYISVSLTAVELVERPSQTLHDHTDLNGKFIDAECQTMPVESPVFLPQTRPSFAPTEVTGDEGIHGNSDQDASARSVSECDQSNIREVDHKESTQAISEDDHTLGHEVSDFYGCQHESPGLTVEKFKVAWRLLNEIRAKYVDGVADETRDDECAESVHEETIQSGPVPRVQHDLKDAMQTAKDLEAENKQVSSPAERNASNAEIRDLLRRSQFHVKDMERWNWSDEASLRLEIEERLRRSQHEYEEAISLSQSVGSFRSWASSAHLHPSRSVTLSPEQEELALQLSTSGFARKTTKTARASCEDTETERIARIMQGSLRRWLDEEDGDDYATSDDEGSGNYF